MRISGKAWLLPFLIVILSGCSDDTGLNPEKEITMVTDFDTRVARTNEYAADLYHKVRESEDNLIISPHSTSVAFAMLYAGARGNTEIEISNVMRFHYPQANGFHPAMSLLNEQICSRGGSNPTEFKIWMANGCWMDKEYHVLQSYQDTLTYYYDAEMDKLDFANNWEQARSTINDWVYDKTAHKIEDAFPPESITPLTCMVLSNVFCFEARWLKCFDPAYTEDRLFTRLDGSTKYVLTMKGEANFDFFDGDGYKALRLPYEGDSVAMMMFLPDEGNYSAFEDSLSGTFISSIYDSLEYAFVHVQIPRFHITTELKLNNALHSMGMVSAFSSGADFSGIDGTDDGMPWISYVQHKTTMFLNEYGTCVYSMTGISLTVGIHPYFKANRPFIFAIIDEPTGVILFLGRVLDANGYPFPFI